MVEADVPQPTPLEELHIASQTLAQAAIHALEAGEDTQQVAAEVEAALEAAGAPPDPMDREELETRQQVELVERLLKANILPEDKPIEVRTSLILRVLAADRDLSNVLGDETRPADKSIEYYRERMSAFSAQHRIKSRRRV